MTEFLFEYGMFASKLVTLLILGILGLAVLASIMGGKHKGKEPISVEKLNDRLDEFRDTLEAEILDKNEIKSLAKQRKKEEKNQKNDENEEENKGRMFVVYFTGDMQASEVDTLRECITAILTVANKNDKVLAIIESEGGMVHTYGLAASQLARFKNHDIHLTVAIDLVAASGGYMMACVADKIIAAPFAVVGSIGVLAQLPNFHRLLDKYNVDIEHHTAGEYKSTLTMLGENTNKARQKFCEELEDTHQLFKTFVSEHRPVVDIDKVATGEHWYASQAEDLKLIDEIITSDDYIMRESKEMDIYEITYATQESIKDKLSQVLDNFVGKLNFLFKMFKPSRLQ